MLVPQLCVGRLSDDRLFRILRVINCFSRACLATDAGSFERLVSARWQWRWPDRMAPSPKDP